MLRVREWVGVEGEGRSGVRSCGVRRKSSKGVKVDKEEGLGSGEEGE